MLSIQTLLVLLPSLLSGAFAAPVARDAPEAPAPASLPPNIYVQGKALTWEETGIATAQGVGSDDAHLSDIVDWAHQESQGWKPPVGTTARRTALINGPSHLVLDYNLIMNNCEDSKLKVTPLGAGLQCSGGGNCTLAHAYGTSTSNMFHMGTKVGISQTVKGEGGVPGVAEVEVSTTMSMEFSLDYTYTSTETESNTYSFGIPISKVCFPTEVSWTSTCQSQIEINSFQWIGSDNKPMYPELNLGDNICKHWQSPKSSPPSGPPPNDFQWLLAGDNDASGNFDDAFHDHFDLITQICSGNMPTPDKDLQINRGKEKLSAVGCLWS